MAVASATETRYWRDRRLVDGPQGAPACGGLEEEHRRRSSQALCDLPQMLTLTEH